MYGVSTGFLQFRDDVLAKGSQESVRLPYGYRTVTVRCMYGSVRCICEHRTDPYVLENTRRILRSLYVARTWSVRVPVMAVSAHTSFWPRTTAYVPSTGKKKMCMHNFQTRAAYGYKGSLRAEKPRRTPCGPVRARTICRTITHGSLEFWPLRCP